MADVTGSINATIFDDTTTYSGVVDANGLHTVGDAISTGSWYPIYLDDLSVGDIASLRVDNAGNLVTRGSVLTDESSFYEPFKGAVLSANWTSVIGTGGSIAVANSICSIASGTTTNAETYICRQIDFSPLHCVFTLSVSQRIANQTIFFGYQDSMTPAGDTMYARFVLSGTDDTKILCATQSSTDTGGNEGLSSPITLPQGLTTAQVLQYKIEFTGKRVNFYIGLTLDTLSLVASRSVQIPDPYVTLHQRVRILNGTSPATTTIVAVDSITSANYNLLDVNGQVTGNVSVQQNVLASIVNSSVANLLAAGTFTGKAESTLGVAGIQCSIRTDQNCTMHVDQSPDGTNWDVTDSFNVLSGIGFATTTQAVNSYVRVRVTNLNGASPTTYFRLQTALCPVVEAVPRALNANGNLKVAINESVPIVSEWQELCEEQHGFAVSSGFITVSGSTETDFMLFRNPVASGKDVEINRIYYTYTKGSGIALMKMYITPTITTVGSAAGITKMYIGGAIAPIALIYTAPTISNRGTLIRAIGNSSVQTFIYDYSLALIIPAGYDLLITITPSANNTDHSVGLDWAEYKIT